MIGINIFENFLSVTKGVTLICYNTIKIIFIFRLLEFYYIKIKTGLQVYRKDMSRLGRDYLQVGYNAEGKVTDEWFMQLSHKYEVERMELKAKIVEYKEQLRQLSESNQNKEKFLSAVRKFMEMKELTPALLKELIDKIEVHETEGVGKNRTQRIVIHYRFIH